MNNEFYRAFEDANRGSRETILQRLHVYQPILKALCLEHGESPRALDIGCGRGEWLELLVECGLDAHGVDLDDGMLEESQNRKLNVLKQDGLVALQQLEANSLSLISLFHVVEHMNFQTMLEIFKEALRVLKPGGLLIAETPNPENLTVGTNSFYLDPTHIKPIPHQLLRFAVTHTGFQRAEVIRLNHPAHIENEDRLRLVNVLFHVSPDYAVVAVKDSMRQAESQRLFDQSISSLKGIDLEWLSETMSAQQNQRIELNRHDIEQILVQIGDLKHVILDQQSSHNQLLGQLSELNQDTMWSTQNFSRQLSILNEELNTLKQHIGAKSSGLTAPAIASPFKQANPFKRFISRMTRLLGRRPSKNGVNRKRHIFVDVSNICINDLNTGIERVVKAYIGELLQHQEFQVVAVKLVNGRLGWNYQTCMEYLQKPALPTNPDFRAGDVFWGLDYFPYGVHLAEKAGVYEAIRNKGVRVMFHVYDILPISHPQFFPEGAGHVHGLWMESLCRTADDLICISNAVANEIRRWAKGKQNQIRPALHAVHLGANLPNSEVPSARDAPTGVGAPYLLSVGTIEPRKGHDQALAAFEHLWSSGNSLNYVIVGQEGWKSVEPEQREYIAKLCSKIESHPEFGRRLHWFKQADDGLLKSLYTNALGVLVPSREEGYGLPLIEAAHYKAPILVRNIAVFREVAGVHATYFEGESDGALASSIKAWARDIEQGRVTRSERMPYLSWSESLRALLNSCGLA